MTARAPNGESGQSIQRSVLLCHPKHQCNADEREHELFGQIGGYLTHTQARKIDSDNISQCHRQDTSIQVCSYCGNRDDDNQRKESKNGN